MERKVIKVGIVQQSCSADFKGNIEKLKNNIKDVAQKGAQLLYFKSYTTLSFLSG